LDSAPPMKIKALGPPISGKKLDRETGQAGWQVAAENGV